MILMWLSAHNLNTCARASVKGKVIVTNSLEKYESAIKHGDYKLPCVIN